MARWRLFINKSVANKFNVKYKVTRMMKTVRKINSTSNFLTAKEKVMNRQQSDTRCDKTR